MRATFSWLIAIDGGFRLGLFLLAGLLLEPKLQLAYALGLAPMAIGLYMGNKVHGHHQRGDAAGGGNAAGAERAAAVLESRDLSVADESVRSSFQGEPVMMRRTIVRAAAVLTVAAAAASPGAAAQQAHSFVPHQRTVSLTAPVLEPDPHPREQEKRRAARG